MESASITWAIGGAVTGAAGTAFVIWMLKGPEMVQQEHAIKEVIEVSKNLTQPDLIKPICEPEFLKSMPEAIGLCRELFCRMTAAAGVSAKTSASDCESIANTNNKAFIRSACKSDSDEETKKCIEFFDRRI